MSKQNQNSGNDSVNYQVGHNQYTATSGSSIYVEEQTTSTELMKKIYEDLAQPGINQVGKAIGTTLGLFNTLMYPIEYINEKYSLIYKNNFEKLRKKLEHENIEDIVDIPLEIGKPLLEKLFYVSDDELSKLFITLLSRASKKDEAHLAHPSFANILASLSPDEARIINYIAPRNFIRCISLRWEKSEKDHGGVSTVTYHYTKRALTGLEEKINILFPENYYMYFTNMSSLGLIQFHEDTTLDEYLTPSEEYQSIIKYYESSVQEGEEDESGYISKIMQGRIDLSELGEMFVRGCVELTEENNQKVKQQGTSVDINKIPRENIGITRKSTTTKGVFIDDPEW